MQITRKDIVSMIGIIKANYTYAYKDVDEDTMRMMIETWFVSLSRYDKQVISVAFQKAIEGCKMPPTLADILQHIKEIKVATEPTDTELWEQLVRAANKTSDCIYYFQFNLVEANGKTQGDNARDRFNKLWDELPQILKDYCGNKHGLIDLSNSDLSFEKGRFLKVLPTLKSRQEIKQTINPAILQLVSGMTKEIGSIDLLPLKDTKN